jgi:hypothetical protein
VVVGIMEVVEAVELLAGYKVGVDKETEADMDCNPLAEVGVGAEQLEEEVDMSAASAVAVVANNFDYLRTRSSRTTQIVPGLVAVVAELAGARSIDSRKPR